MKIQLDTVTKTIKIEESILLGEFIDRIKLILPNKTWKQFTLLTGIIVEWVNPYYIPYPVYPTIPVWPTPFTSPWIVYTTGETTCIDGVPQSGGSVSYNAGVYNIEIQ